MSCFYHLAIRNIWYKHGQSFICIWVLNFGVIYQEIDLFSYTVTVNVEHQEELLDNFPNQAHFIFLLPVNEISNFSVSPMILAIICSSDYAILVKSGSGISVWD